MSMPGQSAAHDLPEWIEPPAPPEFHPRGGNSWVISRYADVSAALRHPNVEAMEPEKAIHSLAERSGTAFPYFEIQLRCFLFSSNPPWHAKARRFVRQAVRQIEQALSLSVAGEIVDDLLAATPRGVEIDAMPSLCDEFPDSVMARGFGVDKAALAEVARRTTALFNSLKRQLPLRTVRDYEVQSEYLAGLLDRTMRGTPTLDAIRATGLKDGEFTDAEIGGLLAFLVIASTDTASTFLGNTLRLLGRRPEIVTAIRDEPDLLRTGIDELFRFGAPIRRLALRTPTEAVEIGGCAIPKGARLLLEAERAHFDPAAYPDPGKVDLRRSGPPSLAFGGGAHTCVGMLLGRQIVTTFLARFIERCEIRLTEAPPDWSRTDLTRRLRSLPMIIEDHAPMHRQSLLRKTPT